MRLKGLPILTSLLGMVFVALFVFGDIRTVHGRDWRKWTQLPEIIEIVPPGPEVPENAAKLSGIWQGSFGESGYSTAVTVIVMEFGDYEVLGIYSWSGQDSGYRVVRGIADDKGIAFHWGRDFRVTLRPNGKDAIAEYERTGVYSKTILTRQQQN